MRPSDVRECVEIVARHPVVGPRYGNLIAELRPAWLGLLGYEALRPEVFEEVDGPQVTLLGMGVSAFVTDDFVREVKTPPYFWIGPELAKRFARGNSPLLSDEEVRDANSNGGLNLIVWNGCIRMEHASRLEVNGTVSSAFMESHRGFRLKELGVQADSVGAWQFLVNTGSLSLLRVGGSADGPTGSPEGLVREPHIFCITREQALSRFGCLTSSLFVHHPPRLRFRRSEQRLLLSALQGGTDEELSDGLGISLSAVKKTWRLVYDRVAERVPGMMPEHAEVERGYERGKEKKQRLLSYLREHPEELRPVSRQP